ncbi:NADH dehydrogenase (Ubiquinone) 30 kDa subunit [uncultured Desulfovibrio sp.]|uniref:NADH dehydrogenase (Ubiquinone) 30 kDa subunit n=1 Tax=uncultured Desulfovibrio sp. TaxID=167968 RepID=A0A212KKW4_9BACT|nr:NADH-quinone oxidoreductase subunit C [Desulfovibrio desulfuricans]MCB6541869.1 NADH-quinone oxidoreductase subunit C [Desulfovibrio desulfuricans]MCB6552865.1 NADH-quinone oxidoreductase subunit C [Desulfovibrio desulfuricans]MCB6564708.1 NADH-quinone oxidoreductase subunit C [Desulfovibrio desulfuricans]MCB7345975.1 NADH-quinone oxidoreductase subunit C [Desulfovibrio desulfuricans]MCQ4859812.1 NADH-quinone oxidoreductase subunit C [Desulfovibrio desulfuricans]
MNAETLGAQLAAQPGASVRAADHASVGYDLDVALPESSLLAAVGIMDGAGYFLEGMTGVDWLGECEALRKEAEAKAKKAAEAAAVSAADAPDTSQAAPPETPVQESIPQEDELEVVYDFNLYSARHRVCLRVRTPRSNPQIHTIAEIYPIAHWHEREIHEFFGIVFIGHPYLIPLLLPEDAEYHPLLKDYSA